MTETGTVVQCKNDFAQVRIGRNSACASCGKCGMTENQKYADFFVQNTLNAQVGDVVQVEIPETNSVPLALVAYVLPLVPALALMFLGFALSLPVWATMLLFAGGFAVGFGIVIVIDKLRKHKWMQSPTLLAIVAKSEKIAATADNGTSEKSDENLN